MDSPNAPINDMQRQDQLCEAIFEYLNTNDTFEEVSRKYAISFGVLKRAYYNWLTNNDGSQPQTVSDLHFELKNRGRPTVLFPDEEDLIEETLKYYIDNNTPLTKHGLMDLVQHTILMLPPSRQQEIPFKDHRPSKRWVEGFLSRHSGLQLKTMRAIDDYRTTAVTQKNIAEHVARLQAAMQRYSIKDASLIFNIDESGTSFKEMCGKSLRKGIGRRSKDLVCTVVRTRGKLDRVTVMPVISAAGTVYKPVVVFPGKQPHFRRVRGVVQTVVDFLPAGSYFYQREVAGVDSDIFLDWAKKFIEETKPLRVRGQKLLLLLDGYAGHIQYDVLKLFKEGNVVVIGMPAHTSHVLQPLDVSVFSSYKSRFQREIHSRGQATKVLDAFDIADALTISYTESLTAKNVVSGFRKTGVWDPNTLMASIEPLKRLPFNDLTNGPESDYKLPTVSELVMSFGKRSRSLLFDADVEESGTIKIKTTSGANLTSQKVIDALEERRIRKSKKTASKTRKAATKSRESNTPGKENEDVIRMTESKAERRELMDLGPRRATQRRRLNETRFRRRSAQKSKVMEAGRAAALLEANAIDMVRWEVEQESNP